MHSSRRLAPEAEEARYREHNNDVDDPAYQKFVAPLFDVMKTRVAPGACGLDFGAGPGPVLARMFEHNGFPMALYDPYFWPDPAVLRDSYDFIVTSETVEHLYHPGAEFRRLRGLLKPGGWLGVMTLVVQPETNFETWYYRRDPTHVVFYSRKTLQWLSASFGFAELTCSGERIALMRRPFHDKPSL